MRLPSVGKIAAGLVLLAILLPLTGCGNGDPGRTQASPEGWTPVWSRSGPTPDRYGVLEGNVFEMPRGFMRIVVAQIDPKTGKEATLNTRLVPLHPWTARRQTFEWAGSMPHVVGEATVSEQQTTHEVLPGKYRLDYWGGTGEADVTVYVGR